MKRQDTSGDAAHVSNDQLSHYVTADCRLDPTEVVQLEDHLSKCSECRNRVASTVERVSPGTADLLASVWGAWTPQPIRIATNRNCGDATPLPGTDSTASGRGGLAARRVHPCGKGP